MHSIECYSDQLVMSWEVCGRKRSWPILKYYPLITLEKLRVATKDLSHDCYGLRIWTPKLHNRKHDRWTLDCDVPLVQYINEGSACLQTRNFPTIWWVRSIIPILLLPPPPTAFQVDICEDIPSPKSRKTARWRYWLRSLQLTLAMVWAGKSDHALFVVSKRYIPGKNKLGWSTLVHFLRCFTWFELYKLRHAVTETRALQGIDMYSVDRRRECYGTRPTPCRSTAFSWVSDFTWIPSLSPCDFLLCVGMQCICSAQVRETCPRYLVLWSVSRSFGPRDGQWCVLPARLLPGKRQLSVIEVCDRSMTQTVM